MQTTKSLQLAKETQSPFWWLSFFVMWYDLALMALGYEVDERGSLGERADRIQWMIQGGE